MRTFLIILAGQLVSQLGTGLTAFALGVWTFQKTGSITQFSLISFCIVMPELLVTPLVGTLVDRWNRRTVMLLADGGAGLCTLIIALLFWSGRLEIWHIYVLVASSSVFAAFQWPALTASLVLLVPRQQQGRATGMIQLPEAVESLASPVAAGFLMQTFFLGTILLIDFATFLFAIATLMIVRIPRPRPDTQTTEEKGSFWHDSLVGLRYVKSRPGLMALLVLFAATNFGCGIVIVLITPLVLGFTTTQMLGTVLSFAGLGMLAGTLVMSAWGGPERKVSGIFGALLFQGAILWLTGFSPSALLIAGAAFGYLFAVPIMNGCSQFLWQTKVAPEVQGRVFAIRQAITASTQPVAFLVAGPLSDYVFEPWLAADGALAGSVGQLIGVGPGRGIAFLFIVLGVVQVLAVLAASRYSHLRRVQEEVPDVVVGSIGKT